MKLRDLIASLQPPTGLLSHHCQDSTMKTKLFEQLSQWTLSSLNTSKHRTARVLRAKSKRSKK